MPTFDTPSPISVAVSLNAGGIDVRAEDRPDTVVEIAPSNPDDAEDVRATEGARADLAGGTLTITAPRPWSRFAPNRTGGAVAVRIALPAGSALECRAAILEVHGAGRLGTCRVTNSVGNVHLQECGVLDLRVGGRVDVGRVDGAAQVHAIEDVHLDAVDGDLQVNNTNGDTRVGTVSGAVHCRAANGRITIEAPRGGVDAKTANGDVRIGEVVRGDVALATSNGRVEIGVRRGTAVRLDVRSDFGRVHSELDQTDGPSVTDETATVHARTHYGDIAITRAVVLPDGDPS